MRTNRAAMRSSSKSDGPVRRLTRHPILLALFLASLVHLSFLSSTSSGQQPPAQLLKQAQSQSDPAKKIELLDEALKDQSLKGDLLSSIFLERAMAHKAMNDCSRAIDDFNSSMAHSRRASSAPLEKAHCLILLDQLDEASRVLETALAMKPGNAQAYVLKGMIYEKEGFPSKAEDEYTRALVFEPDFAWALEMRAKILIKEGKPRRALDDVNALIRLVRGDPEFLMIRARIHVKLKDYAAALADYGSAEALKPGNDRVLKERVLVYFNTDQPEKALEALSGYLAKHADDVEALVLQARAQILLGNYAKAEAILKRALTRDPANASAHLYKGVALVRRTDSDGALGNLNRAIELDPRLVEAYKERARIFLALDEPVRAAADLSSAADLDPSDAEVFVMRGATFMRRLLYDAAIADFTRSLELLPADPRVLYDRAVAYLKEDEPQAALSDLNALLQLRPDAGRALSLRGMIHFQAGSIQVARSEFDRSVGSAPKDPYVWNNRGFFHYKTGDHKAAIEDFNRALKLEPGYEIARYNLSLVLSRQDVIESPGTQAGSPAEPSHR
jgi:tetratricopeptide (TPR) repeat protein